MNPVIHPYITAAIPGIGGIIKESPDDFIVEEIPSYLPCGSGEHCYLTIEKRGITTLDAIRRIANSLKIQERDVGYAGLKDAVGVTRQTFSIQKISPEAALALEIDGLKMLSAVRHSNKLKLGHLKGNRFRVVVRSVSADAIESVPLVLGNVIKRGMPNYFGYQRYGAQGNSHLIGAAMLKRDWPEAVSCLIGKPEAVRDEAWSSAISAYQEGNIDKALLLFPRHCRSERDVLQRLAGNSGNHEKAFVAIHPRMKKLYLSAVQSYLFDQVVASRIETLGKLIDGDLAYKHINGACFLVEDAAAEQGRADAFEISPSGPLFGCKMKQPESSAWEIEHKILEQSNLNLQLFDMSGGLRMEGERRPLRVPVMDLSWSMCEDVLTVEFFLPKGSYATSLIREITKAF